MKSLAIFTLFFMGAIATIPVTHATQPEEKINLNELNWIDKKYFDKQRARVDELGRSNFGTRIRGNKDDLVLVQRLIDGELVGLTDTDIHRALGVVLGDIYVAEQGWQWQEYKDQEGKSHGVCVPKTQQCVFPLSMMTRRLRVTTKIDVGHIYQRGLDLMAETLPKLPYSAPEPVAPTPRDESKRNTITVPFR